MNKEYNTLLKDVLECYQRFTPDKITQLGENQIFVFGTNASGRQQYGAAGAAKKLFGAEDGVWEGRTGNAYALPTKGFSYEILKKAVVTFEQYVRENRHLVYYVTAIGCGHAGYKVEKIAPLFRGFVGLGNVALPKIFIEAMLAEVNRQEAKQEQTDIPPVTVFDFYDESVHEVIKYLQEHDIPFNQEGGFTLTDKDNIVIAEAELGIESEKIVFLPFNDQSESAFKKSGYSICSVEEYLNSKLKA